MITMEIPRVKMPCSTESKHCRHNIRQRRRLFSTDRGKTGDGFQWDRSRSAFPFHRQPPRVSMSTIQLVCAFVSASAGRVV